MSGWNSGLSRLGGFGLMGILLGSIAAPAQAQYGASGYSRQLGIYYQIVGNGARLTANPVAGSPMAQIRLEAGDVITALDGQAIRSGADLDNHVSQTSVTLVDVRTGQTKVGYVNLAGTVAGQPDPSPGQLKLKWKCNAYHTMHDNPSDCSDPGKGGVWVTDGDTTVSRTQPPLQPYQTSGAMQPYQPGLDRSGQRRNTYQPYPGGVNFQAIPYDQYGRPIYGYQNGYNRYDARTGQPVYVPQRPANAPPNYTVNPGR